MFKSIVWATDGSAAADEAATYVKSLAAESGAEVVLLHADQLLVGRGGGQHLIADEEEVEAKIARQAAELRDAGITAAERIVHVPAGESPARTIANAAEDLGSDLIVVGTPGHTQLGGLLLGRTSTRLLQIAPCPVFVVPAGKAARMRDDERAVAETAS